MQNGKLWRATTVQVGVEVPGSTQTAGEQRSAEAQLRTLIDMFAPAQLRLIAAIRRWLRKRLPTAHEVVYEYRDWFVISYLPNERGYAPPERGLRQFSVSSLPC
jgi:hypothetical protein